MRISKFRHSVPSFILAAALCAPTAAWAQEATEDDGGLGEIVVTAQKREQSMQDVPVSITALGGDTLAANRVTTARDLDALVPNLVVRQQFGASGLPLYTIRGALASASAPGADRGVAVYIDGVYLNAASGSMFEMAEVERIEVLRGPQGTLFGRNSTGGAISFTTREPSDEFSLRQNVSVGNRSLLRSQTTLHTGAFGAFSASLTYLHSEFRGDIRNLAAGTVWDFTPAFGGKTTKYTSPKWLGSSNTEAVTAAVKFEPSDRFKAVYRFDWSDSDQTGDGVGLAYARPTIRAAMATQNQALMTPTTYRRPDAVNNGNTVPVNLRASGHSLTMSYDLTDSLSIKSITAYRKTRAYSPWTEISGVGVMTNTGGPEFAALLGGATPAAIAANAALIASTAGAPFLVQATSTAIQDKQFSEEVQLNYNSDLVTVTAGAIYFRNKQIRTTAGESAGTGRARSGGFRVYPDFVVPFSGQAAGGGGRPTDVVSKSYAAYGQAEVHATPELDLIGAIRYTKDRKTGTDRSSVNTTSPGSALPIDYKGSKVTFGLGANYKITPDVMAYAKYSTGYISGGAIAGIPWDPETAKSWEGGVKASWFGNKLRTNLAVFSVKYDNLQTGVAGVNLTPSRPDIALALINVGSAKAKGFELETQLAPARGLTFSGGLGYTDFKYLSLLPILTAGNDEVLPQNRPKWTANVSGQYETPPLFDDVTLTARIDASWRSTFYPILGVPRTSAAFTPAEQAVFRDAIVIKPYWLVNSRVSLDGFEIGGAEASLSLWARNLFNEDSPSYALSLTNVVGYQYEKARSFGVDLEVKF